MAERRTLTIESSYCANWTIQDAIREVIQNGLDTGTEVTFKRDGNLCEISDGGLGLNMSDFIIGRSSKRDNKNVMGQFGEGIKIGCLVLARENRQIKILSLGKQYTFSLQYDETWQSKLLTIDVEERQTAGKGTIVIVECSEEEVATARSLFMKLNPKPILDTVLAVDSEIIDAPGIVYVNGLRVTKIKAVYGYNFNKKELVNRDRAAIGHSQIKDSIADVLSYTTNVEIISNLLELASTKADDSTLVELDVTFNPRRNIWLKVIRKMYGRKVCLSSHDPTIDLTAMEKNWRVLQVPWSFWYSLQRILAKANMVIKDTKRIISYNSLSAVQKEFFNRGKRISDEIAGEAGLTPYPVKIFVDKEKKDATRLFNFNQLGYYVDGVAGVCHQTIKELDLGKFVGTLLHEYVHGNCGHTDNTRDFENDLTDVIASLGLALITEKAKAKKVGLNYGLKRSGNET